MTRLADLDHLGYRVQGHVQRLEHIVLELFRKGLVWGFWKLSKKLKRHFFFI